MRTTITIDNALLRKARQLTHKKGYSQAIVTSIREFVAMKERLGYLDSLYTSKLPHSYLRIKKGRQKRKWCS